MRISDWSSDVCSSDLRVGVETVTFEIDAVDPRGDRVAERGIDASFYADRVEITVGECAIATELKCRRGGVDADQAGRRVAPAQRALRAAQNFDPLDRAKLAQGIDRKSKRLNSSH